MRHFIFLTQEGITKTPSDLDIENLQVLGITQGNSYDDAFNNFLKEHSYLLDYNYKEVIAIELKNENQHYFSLVNNI